ncbi:MAG: molybdopterin molybdotransferase MoeA [Verrucomicrobiota bacterium]|nr:molybdopterin molybdotransferase MoeA [Verrucomicrobiota bacterium]
MLSLEEALARIIRTVKPLSSEKIPIVDADERIIAGMIKTAIPLPLFDNSAMDGYALRSDDLVGASREKPVSLKLIGEAPAGRSVQFQIRRGECVRIFTGSPIPSGVDAVLMQEDTHAIGSEIQCFDKTIPGENIRRRGEDIETGTILCEPGRVVGPGLISLLASCGISEIPVIRRARVALLATGDELQQPGRPLAPGQIYESNRTTLATLLRRTGAIPSLLPVVPDTLKDTVAALDQALTLGDLVVTSGGASVGGHDYIKEALQKLGGTLDLWRVAIKPGKPFLFGQCRGKLLFGLPGNPVSAFVTFLAFVRPALLFMQGQKQSSFRPASGNLVAAVQNPGDRRHFFRVRLREDGKVEIPKGQASHMLHSLSIANGLIDVPPATNLAAGTTVQVLLF